MHKVADELKKREFICLNIVENYFHSVNGFCAILWYRENRERDNDSILSLTYRLMRGSTLN